MTLFRDKVVTKYVPAVAVKRAPQVLIGLTRRKEFAGNRLRNYTTTALKEEKADETDH